jgi:hypothetical protein
MIKDLQSVMINEVSHTDKKCREVLIISSKEKS